jgi:hypothetical protein
VGYGIAIDATGNAYVTGYTQSPTFPTKTGSYDTFYATGAQALAFITKLNPAGSALIYSTFLGPGPDLTSYASTGGYGIAIDATGAAYVTGVTSSDIFPTTPGAYIETSIGRAEPFVTKLNAAGNGLVYSTYLGHGTGLPNPSSDVGWKIAVDAAGAAYVTGDANSPTYPTTPGSFDPTFTSAMYTRDAFVTKLNPAGSGVEYSTFLGGINQEGWSDIPDAFCAGIAVDRTGAVYVTGCTRSPNFPTTAGAFTTKHKSGQTEAYVTKLTADGSGMVFSTLVGDAAPGFTDTAGVYLPASGAVFLRNSNTPGPADLVYTLGAPNAGYMPLGGDWGHTYADKLSLYQPSTSTFDVKYSPGPGPADDVVGFGAPGQGYQAIGGNFGGDGYASIGLYSATTGFFYLQLSPHPGPANLAFGFGPANAGLVPIAGDWDGDGKDTVGLYDPATGAFFLKNSNTAGPADLVFTFGAGGVGYVPIAGDWDGDGIDTVGLYNPQTQTFYLRNSNTSGSADVVFNYGPAGATPIAGNWDGR